VRFITLPPASGERERSRTWPPPRWSRESSPLPPGRDRRPRSKPARPVRAGHSGRALRQARRARSLRRMAVLGPGSLSNGHFRLDRRRQPARPAV